MWIKLSRGCAAFAERFVMRVQQVGCCGACIVVPAKVRVTALQLIGANDDLQRRRLLGVANYPRLGDWPLS